jgi:hypothetical protein
VHVHDAETLAAAARRCSQARGGPGPASPEQRVQLVDLRELLACIDDNPAVDPSVQAVPALAGLAALTAEPGPDLGQLAHLLAEAGQTDLVLTDETEQTYQRIADWMNTTLTGGDPLEHWAW